MKLCKRMGINNVKYQGTLVYSQLLPRSLTMEKGGKALSVYKKIERLVRNHDAWLT